RKTCGGRVVGFLLPERKAEDSEPDATKQQSSLWL
ncbi:hypothetical protein AVEN_182273-1, partial [Araneus ventricosus]